MGHDEHFLTRLDRVNRPTVEYALSLYRDAGLVRALLASGAVPEGAERVALSLGDTERGPFVVVARDGHFVTCLGEGMWPRGLPVLPRSHLDEVTQRVAAARTARARAVREAGRHGAVGQLVARFYRGGEFLSREEVLALRFWAPALFHDLWEIMLSFTSSAHDLRESLAAERDPGAGRHAERLQGFFHGTWASLHLLTLLSDCDNARAYLERFIELEPVQGRQLLPTLTGEMFTMGTACSSLRAAWINARLGRFALGAHKAWLRADAGFWTSMSSCYALVAVGSRQSRSRAEALKALDGVGAIEGPDPLDGARAAVARSAARVLREPEGAREWADATGRAHLFGLSRTFDRKVGWSARTPAEVPADLVVAALVDRTDAVFPSIRRGIDYLHGVPTVAPASLGDLYYPQSVQSQFARAWSAERALAWVRPWQEYRRARAPATVRRAETPGRNDPCACGSGRKSKRCCAAA
jgi:hypothetical protein